ncbi:MAG: hypothetical protein AB7F28_08380 [Candidatus Margulisiibacteriota bacterium]
MIALVPCYPEEQKQVMAAFLASAPLVIDQAACTDNLWFGLIDKCRPPNLDSTLWPETFVGINICMAMTLALGKQLVEQFNWKVSVITSFGKSVYHHWFLRIENALYKDGLIVCPTYRQIALDTNRSNPGELSEDKLSGQDARLAYETLMFRQLGPVLIVQPHDLPVLAQRIEMTHSRAYPHRQRTGYTPTWHTLYQEGGRLDLNSLLQKSLSMQVETILQFDPTLRTVGAFDIGQILRTILEQSQQVYVQPPQRFEHFAQEQLEHHALWMG